MKKSKQEASTTQGARGLQKKVKVTFHTTYEVDMSKIRDRLKWLGTDFIADYDRHKDNQKTEELIKDEAEEIATDQLLEDIDSLKDINDLVSSTVEIIKF